MVAKSFAVSGDLIVARELEGEGCDVYLDGAGSASYGLIASTVEVSGKWNVTVAAS